MAADEEPDPVVPLGFPVAAFGDRVGAAKHDDPGVVHDPGADGAAGGGLVERGGCHGREGLGLDTPERVHDGGAHRGGAGGGVDDVPPVRAWFPVAVRLVDRGNLAALNRFADGHVVQDGEQVGAEVAADLRVAAQRGVQPRCFRVVRVVEGRPAGNRPR